MYLYHFGLSELPFTLTPNTDFYLGLAPHHEALEVLTTALKTGEGFIKVCGEVGTGKTTISRRLIEQLPENTQVAYILNPTLSSQELLATICDELKIRYRKTGATLKTLTDKIQEKLLQNHEQEINTLLIIDEAQHLQPEVLEQLRLLTNLETNTKKLLQVILIGQPELQQLLQRRDLRQLAQRITARYHLLPLNKKEIGQYIKHRLTIVDCHREIFNKGAISQLHKLTQGIPRLINLVCDKALMEAYGSNDAIINRKIIVQSAERALGPEYQVEPWWQQKPFIGAIALLIVIGAVFGGMHWQKAINQSEMPAESSINNSSFNNKAQTEAPSILPQVIEQAESVAVESKSPTTSDIETVSTETLPNSDSNISEVNNSNVDELVQNIDEPETIEINQASESSQSLKVEATEGVSDELLSRFQSAIDATENEETIEQTIEEPLSVPPLSDMPMWVQEGVPSLSFDMHIYATDGEGWVRVNGKDRYENDPIAKDLTLEQILPQQVILNYQGQKFSLPALSTW